MSNHRNIIDKNLVALCDLTNCNDILIDRCTERDVLTRAEKDEIEIGKIMFKRNRTLYEIMRRKDESTFQELVEIMKEESTAQSGDVLKILDGNQPAPLSQRRPKQENLVEPDEKSIWFNVQDPITSFVGRENELKKLHEIVTRNADNDTQVAVMSQLTSVSGMGGIGKTTLAREYVKQYASYFNNNIIWINAETISSTEKSFRELADKIGDQNKIVENQGVKEVPISKVTTDTYEHLSRRKCLFVFDNVEEYRTTVAPFVPESYEPGKIRPYILMTSRKQRLVDDCKVLRLDILAMGEAEKFIKSKLQNCMCQIDDESVKKLAHELECLPLALHQAVSYIRNQVLSKSFFPRNERNHIEEYLKLLEENPKVPFSHKYQDETMDEYAYTVMRTWDVTLKAIQEEEYGDQAIEVLEMLAYYPPENIDIEEFIFGFSKEKLERGCVILEQYSLINRVREYVNIHRLVQQVIRVQNKEKGREEYNLGRCLSLTLKHTKWYYIDRYTDRGGWYPKLEQCYEDLVIRFRSILGKISLSTNTTDLEILNSALIILEKDVTQDVLIFLYYIFIVSAFDKCVKNTDYVLDFLAQKAMTRLNLLIEMKHEDTLCYIVSYVHFYNIRNPIPGNCTSKFARDIIHVISKYCYEHSAEILRRHDSTPYYLIKWWLRVKQLGQCRMCFKLLVLGTGTESIKNAHPVFYNFHLFNKYLLQLGIITDENEREFVREVLDFCRSLPLDKVEIGLDEIDVLLCNILCLILLNCKRLHEILACVFKISVVLRKGRRFINLKDVFVRKFKRTIEDFVFTLNSVVIIGTTPLISSDWAHYVDKIIKFIGTYEKIMEIDNNRLRSDREYLKAGLRELDYRSCELTDCCRWTLSLGKED